MTIENAVKTLEIVLGKINDEKVKTAVTNVINLLNNFKEDALTNEEGNDYNLPQEIKKLINNMDSNAPPRNIDFAWAQNLNNAVSEMTKEKNPQNGQQKKHSNSLIALVISVVLMVGGFVLAFIIEDHSGNNNFVSADTVYFGIESIKDIIGIVFETFGIVVGTSSVIGMDKKNQYKSAIKWTLVLFIFSGLGALLTFIFSSLALLGKQAMWVYIAFEVLFMIVVILSAVYICFGVKIFSKENSTINEVNHVKTN